MKLQVIRLLIVSLLALVVCFLARWLIGSVTGAWVSALGMIVWWLIVLKLLSSLWKRKP
jgi:hypothetical protein